MNIKLLLTTALLTAAVAVNAQYTNLHNFSATEGGLSYGHLISDSTYLYGMSAAGGTSNNGFIFKIKPDGTMYDTVMNFNGLNGSQPFGSFLADGGYYYAMTSQGGANGYGVIFKIRPDGTGYTKLMDFNGSTTGADPYGSLIFDGTYLYGMTYNAGTDDYGTIFKIKEDGTGYVNIYNFSGSTSFNNGANPYGSLIMVGTRLYGLTYEGGSGNEGVMFSIKPDGTGYTNLYSFTYASGVNPQASFIYDGTYLYAMNRTGGSFSGSAYGDLFKIKPDGTGFAHVLDFDGTNGYDPSSDVIYDGNYLYGMSIGNGPAPTGSIFRVKPDGTGYLKLHEFTIPGGTNPGGSLYSDGTFLYGITSQDGANGKGTIFKLAPSTLDVSAQQEEENKFSIYPNPAAGMFSLTTTGMKITKLCVYNALSQCVYQLAAQQLSAGADLSIDLGNQPNGVYMISLQTENGWYTKKLVLQR